MISRSHRKNKEMLWKGYHLVMNTIIKSKLIFKNYEFGMTKLEIE